MNNEVTIERIRFLQLENYFLKQGYLRISIFSNSRRLAKNECWMVKMEDDGPYLAVRISDETAEQRKQSMGFVLQTVEKLRETVDSNKKLLDISVSMDSENQDSSFAKYVRANSEIPFDESLLNQFPGLNGVFAAVEDLQQEEKNLLREINHGGMSRRKRGGILQSLKKAPRSTLIVCGICVAVFIAQVLVSAIFDVDDVAASIVMGASYKAMITCCHQYWRLITSVFTHGGILHLICNLYSFIRINGAVEEIYGKTKTIIIFFASALLSSSLEYCLETNTVLLGLSGVIYGLFGALSVEYFAKGYLKDPVFLSSYIRLAVINTVISFLPSVSLVGHLGGLIAGATLGILFNEKCDKLLKINCGICFIIVIAFTAYMSVKNANFAEFYFGTDSQVANVYTQIGLKKQAEKMLEQLFAYYMTYGG